MSEDQEEVDTDTKLAILASLLEPASYPLADLLEALQAAGGDVAQAAEAVLLPRVQKAGKRKAGSSLQSWLGKKHTSSPSSITFRNEEARASSPSSPPHKDVQGNDWNIDTKPKPSPVNLMNVLKHPTTPEKAKNVPRPAVHLPNQRAIDVHSLPLTLLQSPLSPAMASALYLTMMEESETWERNKFYLAGKWVESPHTVCHYARDPPPTPSDVKEGEGSKEVELLEGKEGKKATYMWSGQEIAASRVSLLASNSDDAAYA
jgi:hypothetical protein